MGRPKKENAKTRYFKLRLTEEDYQLLNAISEEFNTTKTGVLLTGFYELMEKFSINEWQKINERLNKK